MTEKPRLTSAQIEGPRRWSHADPSFDHRLATTDEDAVSTRIWQPESGETLLARAPVTFATGAAMRVRGKRWFRDTERRDIQDALPGWPEGPVHAARSATGSAARNAVKVTAMVVGVAVMAVLSSAGGNVTGTNTPSSGSGTPDDRDDEVLDFPVIWAAPGAIARTLPWQLDPGRSDEKRYCTHAIVTDRRLVIVGFPFDKKDLTNIQDEVLWEVPRTAVSHVARKNFKTGSDFKVTFSDGSWCRLSSFGRQRLIRYLMPIELIAQDSLTAALRAAVDAYVSKVQPPAGVSPVVSRPPGGNFRVEFLLPEDLDAYFGASERNTLVDAEGRRVAAADYRPEDL
ncbi:hypothetical protein [Streptomyces sp. NPDC005385]|uniref:hypothetical protein n=1 Tax=Streptomyces sp. NPDC005385 TaxID=3157039 RepID=UPI0033B34168